MGDMTIQLVIGVLVLGLLSKVCQRPAKGLKYPPGPKGNWVIGNLDLLRNLYDQTTQKKWREEYGDIISVSILGKRIIMIFSEKIANDLFEKRSSIYSDRPEQPIMRLTKWNLNFGTMPYGDRWRRHHRLFHQYFNCNAVKKYIPIQTEASRTLMRHLYETPKDFGSHIGHYTSWMIMKITYDYNLNVKEDQYLDTVREALKILDRILNPGSTFLDFFSWLEHIPEWVPGNYKRNAKIWSKPVQKAFDLPFQITKENLADGRAGPSVMASCLSKLQSTPDAPLDEEGVIMQVLGLAYIGGAGTTFTVLMTIIQAMAMYPDIQRAAQKEIDAVVGDRLPTVEDSPQLPYVNAICQETLRWRPFAPFAAAHAAFRDDIYGDYFIPEGSIVMGNVWTILRDEKAYGSNPDKFNPERFFAPGVKSPTAQYGFARRICPGRHLAKTSLFLATATILKVFDISPALDGNGKEIPIMGDIEGRSVTGPGAFDCIIKPRSPLTEKLILENSFAP